MTPRVSIIAPGPERTSYRLRWTDPVTGKRNWRSAETADRREADRAAARLEEELATGVQATDSRITWDAFRARYETEALPGLAVKTQANYKSTMNLVQELLGVRKLAGFSAALLSDFAAKLRAKGRAEDSVKTHINQLSAMLGWAKRMKLLAFVPERPRVKRVRSAASPMKGRPLTDTEFAAMLAATPGVVGDRAAASWQHWLTGLWWSGLRIEESLLLSWDATAKLGIDLTGKFVMLRVRRHWEKGHKDRMLPIAPEFADFLKAIPEYNRVGLVFRLQSVEPNGTKGGRSRSMPGEIDAEWAGTICRRIGKAAGIAVDTLETGRIKWASAHDLRRSFGSRWASRVMPPDLMAMMRHEDIKTTMKYYVGHDAERTSEAIYAAYRLSGGSASNGSISGSTEAKKGKRASRKKTPKTDTETT